MPQNAAEESYQSLEVYAGPKSNCDNCSRKFVDGEVISAAKSPKLVFCYSDGDGGCLIAYVFSSQKMTVMMTGVPMRFGSGSLPLNQQTPNYPNTPIVGRTGEIKSTSEMKPKSWLKRLLSL